MGAGERDIPAVREGEEADGAGDGIMAATTENDQREFLALERVHGADLDAVFGVGERGNGLLEETDLGGIEGDYAEEALALRRSFGGLGGEGLTNEFLDDIDLAFVLVLSARDLVGAALDPDKG